MTTKLRWDSKEEERERVRFDLNAANGTYFFTDVSVCEFDGYVLMLTGWLRLCRYGITRFSAPVMCGYTSEGRAGDGINSVIDDSAGATRLVRYSCIGDWR